MISAQEYDDSSKSTLGAIANLNSKAAQQDSTTWMVSMFVEDAPYLKRERGRRLKYIGFAFFDALLACNLLQQTSFNS